MFLKNLENRLSICQIYDIVFIISIIPRELLIGSTFPNAINFEFILISSTIQLLQKIMSRTPYDLVLTQSNVPSIINSNINPFHFFSGPWIKLSTNFNIISSKWPIKDMFDFINKCLLILHQKLLLLLLNYLKLFIAKLSSIRIDN